MTIAEAKEISILRSLDGVYIDSIYGIPGTVWPIGTPGVPVDNLTDAISIAAARRIHRFVFLSDDTIDDNIPANSLITGVAGSVGEQYGGVYIGLTMANPAAQCRFQNLCIGGNAGGAEITFDNCKITASLTNLGSSDFTKCMIDADITGDGHDLLFRHCVFHFALRISVNKGYIYISDCTQAVDSGWLEISGRLNTAVYNFISMAGGYLRLINITDAASWLQIHSSSGLIVVVAASCTQGTIECYGNITIINNSGGTTVNDYTNRPKAEVPVNITADAGSETDFLNLATAGFHYTIDDLVLKCVDPGANHVHVRLYKLVNGVSTMIHEFEINSAGPYTRGISGPFTNYYSLDDMFTRPIVAGDNIRIAVQSSAGGPYAVTGSYAYRSA